MMLDLTGFCVFMSICRGNALFLLFCVYWVPDFCVSFGSINISFVRRFCPVSINFCVNKTKCSNCNLITAWAKQGADRWRCDDPTEFCRSKWYFWGKFCKTNLQSKIYLFLVKTHLHLWVKIFFSVYFWLSSEETKTNKKLIDGNK